MRSNFLAVLAISGSALLITAAVTSCSAKKAPPDLANASAPSTLQTESDSSEQSCTSDPKNAYIEFYDNNTTKLCGKNCRGGAPGTPWKCFPVNDPNGGYSPNAKTTIMRATTWNLGNSSYGVDCIIKNYNTKSLMECEGLCPNCSGSVNLECEWGQWHKTRADTHHGAYNSTTYEEFTCSP